MSLTFIDTIQRTGYTIIDDKKIVQYTCTIPSDNPEGMRMTSTRLDTQAYKDNRDICRADLAEFENSCYELQDELIAKKGE